MRGIKPLKFNCAAPQQTNGNGLDCRFPRNGESRPNKNLYENLRNGDEIVNI